MSIQALILVEKPYANEPSFESRMATAAGKRAVEMHNAQLRLATLRHAMVDVLRAPPAGFERAARLHFWLKRAELRAQLGRWLAEIRSLAGHERALEVRWRAAHAAWKAAQEAERLARDELLAWHADTSIPSHQVFGWAGSSGRDKSGTGASMLGLRGPDPAAAADADLSFFRDLFDPAAKAARGAGGAGGAAAPVDKEALGRAAQARLIDAMVSDAVALLLGTHAKVAGMAAVFSRSQSVAQAGQYSSGGGYKASSAAAAGAVKRGSPVPAAMIHKFLKDALAGQPLVAPFTGLFARRLFNYYISYSGLADVFRTALVRTETVEAGAAATAAAAAGHKPAAVSAVSAAGASALASPAASASLATPAIAQPPKDLKPAAGAAAGKPSVWSKVVPAAATDARLMPTYNPFPIRFSATQLGSISGIERLNTQIADAFSPLALSGRVTWANVVSLLKAGDPQYGAMFVMTDVLDNKPQAAPSVAAASASSSYGLEGISASGVLGGLLTVGEIWDGSSSGSMALLLGGGSSSAAAAASGAGAASPAGAPQQAFADWNPPSLTLPVKQTAAQQWMHTPAAALAHETSSTAMSYSLMGGAGGAGVGGMGGYYPYADPYADPQYGGYPGARGAARAAPAGAVAPPDPWQDSKTLMERALAARSRTVSFADLQRGMEASAAELLGLLEALADPTGEEASMEELGL